MKLPINRVVAFLGPYIAVISGAVADWLLVHVHVLGLFHTSKTAVTGIVTQGVVFILTAGLVWLGQQKWLSGWQKWEQGIVAQMPDDLADQPDADLTTEEEPASEDFSGPLLDPTDPEHPANQPSEPEPPDPTAAV